MDTSVNYYDILRLSKGGDGGGGDGGVAKFTPRTSMRSLFDVDLVELRQQFLKSQQKLHPDTFSQKTEEERLYSEQQSSFANKAYQTLKNPLLRAKYLLFLHGEPLEESSLEEKLNPVMLMMVMDVREALEDATTLSQVRKLASSNDLRYERTCAKISKGFAVNDLNAVRKDVIELQYWDSIRRAIEDKMDEELDEE